MGNKDLDEVVLVAEVLALFGGSSSSRPIDEARFRSTRCVIDFKTAHMAENSAQKSALKGSESFEVQRFKDHARRALCKFGRFRDSPNNASWLSLSRPPSSQFFQRVPSA